MRVDDFCNVRSPRRVRGQRSEVRDRGLGGVSRALYKPAQSAKRCQSEERRSCAEVRRSLETSRGEAASGGRSKPAVPGEPACSGGESRRELASQRQGGQR